MVHLLGFEAENARTVLTHPLVLRLRNPATAHLSAPSCVPDQTPPRPQLIQCDNDLYPFQAWPPSYGCSSSFSLLSEGRQRPLATPPRTGGSAYGGSVR